MLKYIVLALLVLGTGMIFTSLAPAAIEQAPKLAELRKETETLWHFVTHLTSSFEVQVIFGLFVSGVIGMIASWLWKWSQGNADGWRHFTLKYIVGQLLWLAGSSIAAVATIGFQTESGEFFGWLTVLWTGGFAGFGGEFKIQRPVWTQEKREAKSG